MRCVNLCVWPEKDTHSSRWKIYFCFRRKFHNILVFYSRLDHRDQADLSTREPRGVYLPNLVSARYDSALYLSVSASVSIMVFVFFFFFFSFAFVIFGIFTRNSHWCFQVQEHQSTHKRSKNRKEQHNTIIMVRCLA